MRWLYDFDEYHDKGDPQCPACMVPPESCICGGFVHNQLEQEELQEFQKMCDHCHGSFVLVKEQICAG